MKNELMDALTERVESGDAAVAYALKYFSMELFDRKSPPGWRLTNALKGRLNLWRQTTRAIAMKNGIRS